MPPATKDAMRTTLQSHAAYRASNGYPKEQVDLSWKSDWSTGAAAYYGIFEANDLMDLWH